VLFDVLGAVEAVNARQKRKLGEKVAALFDGRLEGKTIAVWGLAFKAETDDMRESPAIDLIESLLAAGAEVHAHDPGAMETAQRLFGDRIRYARRMYDAVEEADALVIVTEWLEYRNPDFERIRSRMHGARIVDGRNLYDPTKMQKLGFTYVSLGRNAV
jgi:UDPglucose 6-dehydrogenase